LLVPVALALVALWVTPAIGDSEVMLYAVPSGGETMPGSSDCQAGQPACALSLALHQSNDGSLNSDAVVINLAAGTYGDSEYYVNQGEPSTLVFDGAGTAGTIMAGGGTNPVFKTDRNFPVTIKNMTLESGGGNGVAVLAEPTGDETVTLEDVLVKGAGGSEHTADALLRATSGGLLVEDSTVENFAGLGIAGDGGEISVEDSTIAGGQYGVGVQILGASGAQIKQSTLSGDYSGLLDMSTGVVDITFSTFSNNSRDVELEENVTEDITIGSSILADECLTSTGTITDGGYNVVAGNNCFGDASKKSAINVGAGALGLGSLAWNGGPTQTVAISSTSDARNFAPAGICNPTDQRGIARPQPGSDDCDVGAYQYAPPTLSSASPGSGLAGSSVTLTGTNLIGVTGVTLAGAAATVTAQSNTSITLTVPSVTPGATSIVAHGTDGSPSLAFTVTAPPTTPTPAPTPAPTLTPTPSITLSGFSVNKHKGTATVKLGCAGAPCRGELALSLTLHRKVKLHGHEVNQKVVILLGTHKYDLAAGASDEITIALDKTGRKDIEHASRKHPLSLSLSASTIGVSIVKHDSSVT
jgi:hypothetical protein